MPYTYETIEPESYEAIEEGLRNLERGTCLKFVKKNDYPMEAEKYGYIDFHRGTSCNSGVGRHPAYPGRPARQGQDFNIKLYNRLCIY